MPTSAWAQGKGKEDTKPLASKKGGAVTRVTTFWMSINHARDSSSGDRLCGVDSVWKSREKSEIRKAESKQEKCQESRRGDEKKGNQTCPGRKREAHREKIEGSQK